MHARRTPPLPGSLLLRGWLLTLVLAIAGGILGMHVVGSAQATPITPSHVSIAGMAAGPTVAAAAADGHPAASPVLPATELGEGLPVPGHQGSSMVCGCLPFGCDGSMAGHGACIPFAGSATPAAPQPGRVPDPATDSTVTGHAWSKAADRVPDTPSLTQLSISRT